MSDYLEEAARRLRKVAEDNERENARYPGFLREGRMAVAREFAKLAAIERGIAPADLEISEDASP